MSDGLYSVQLLARAIMVMADAVTPFIFGLLLVGLLVALVQGALQVEDGTMMMAARLAAALLTAVGAMAVVFRALAGLAREWIANIPGMIDRVWS
ncbi:MAG TPA: flagellar biosynthetic protein FliQ [Acetobacteraceae bacterium]|jgi:flagellar biosynthesis protein FliQ|nr:flagellar biosynthetic protein FliQ [Acetobacteraceae bacterium]